MTTPAHLLRPRAACLLALALVLLTVAVSCADEAAIAPAAAGDLRQAPWAHQPDGSPSIHDVPAEASLGFPPGVTYAQALTQLLVSAARTGQPPPGTVVLDPLPAEVVYVTPAGPGDGIRLSLTAPWGWVPATGAIRAPSYSLPGSLPAEEAVAAARAARASGAILPEGAEADVPVLAACEIAHGTPDARVPCS